MLPVLLPHRPVDPQPLRASAVRPLAVSTNDRYEGSSRGSGFTRRAYRGRVAEQRPPEPHRTSTVENGPFCAARCTCGWRGPARRARSRARTDAADHMTQAL
ncbi:hypothetical protein GCM10010349_27440 [Streptomyces flavofungini]|nr:hypothetical protein GCM10010349_27440 [Streptomyces flavofungini]